MSEPTEAQLAKLPRWAKDFIAQKDRRIREVEDVLAVMKGEMVAAAQRDRLPNVWPRAVLDYYGDRVPVAVSPYDSVTFLTFPDDDEERRMEMRVRHNGEVEVMGSYDLVVVPNTSNSVKLVVKSRYER